MKALRQADTPFMCWRSIRSATATSESARPTAWPNRLVLFHGVQPRILLHIEVVQHGGQILGDRIALAAPHCWAVHFSSFT